MGRFDEALHRVPDRRSTIDPTHGDSVRKHRRYCMLMDSERFDGRRTAGTRKRSSWIRAIRLCRLNCAMRTGTSVMIARGRPVAGSKRWRTATGTSCANVRGGPRVLRAWRRSVGAQARAEALRSWTRSLLAPASRTTIFAEGDYATARARYAKAFPELFAQDAAEDRRIVTPLPRSTCARAAAHWRGASGRKALLDRSEAYSFGRCRAWDRRATGSRTCRSTRCAATRPKALAALREAEQAGWRGPLWRYYRDFDPNLASIRNEPEFKAVFADIERDMAQQRARLAARPKDAPLELTDASR